MADLYWVAGAGNWSDAGLAHWSTATGGAPGHAPPTSADNAHFDAGSNTTNAAYTVTIDATANCLDLMFDAKPGDGLGGTITWAGGSDMNVSGSFKALTGMTRSWSGALNFVATSGTKTLTNNGVNQRNVVFNGTGGTFQLVDALVTDWRITRTAGTFSANGKLVTFSGLALNGVTAGDFTGTSAFASVTCDGSNNGALTLGGDISVTGTLTFNNVNGAASRALVSSSVVGTPRTITAAAVSLTDVDFGDITFANSTAPGTPFTGTRLGNAAGNSGDITFTAGVPKYYVGNTANWNGAVWALTDGGAPAANNFPLPQDTATFTANSFSANGQTVTVNGNFRLPGIDLSGMTNRTGVTFATGTKTPTCYGDLKLTTAGTFAVSGTGVITLSGRNTQTIASNGVAWTQPFTVNSIGGTVRPADTFTTATTVTTTHTAGTLDTNNHAWNTGRFATSGSTARTIKDAAGTGKIATTDTTAATVFTATTTANLTVDRTNAWTIEIGGNTANIRTADLGSGKSWPALTFTNTTANGELDLVCASTTTVLKSLAVSAPPQTIKRTAATTITIEATDGFPSGTLGNFVTIGSITVATHTWAKSGGGTVGCDYLSISHSTATPGATWYAGPLAHSTDGGTNSGWIFTAAPQHYTFTVAQGAFTLTGEAALFKAARKLVVTQGAYTLAGKAARLAVGRKLAVAQGAFTLTGEAVLFKAARKLVVTQGAYTLAGKAARLAAGRKLAVARGSFTYTGEPAVLRHGYVFAAAKGAYTLTGEAVTWTVARKITASRGAYTYTGYAVKFWGPVQGAQTPGWVLVTDSQTPGWGTVDDSQTPGWAPIVMP